jgi:hypothetical protein
VDGVEEVQVVVMIRRLRIPGLIRGNNTVMSSRAGDRAFGLERRLEPLRVIWLGIAGRDKRRRRCRGTEDGLGVVITGAEVAGVLDRVGAVVVAVVREVLGLEAVRGMKVQVLDRLAGAELMELA